jgi:hypothetical protein
MTISRAADSHSRAVIRCLVKHAFDAEILVYVGPVHTIRSPMISKLFLWAGVASLKRHDHVNGTLITRPSTQFERDEFVGD